jgi:hypothetical protein
MGAWDWAKDKIDPGDLLHQNNVPNQAGANTGNGDTFDQRNLKQDPTTGYYMDVTTGTIYQSPYGGNVITDPNVAQQVARNFGTSQEIIKGLATARTTGAQALSGQNGLVQDYQSTINGSAPSVAQNQLTQNLGNIQRTQMALASGTGGANAFAAKRAAAANISTGQLSADQAAATLRAQEVNAARTGQGQVLQSIAGNANDQAGQSIAGGSDYAKLALSGQAGQQGLNLAADTANTAESNDKAQRLVGAVGGTVSKMYGGK